MRRAFSRQQRLDGGDVLDAELNLECRDEMVPILRALQHIYGRPELRDELLELVAADVNADSDDDCGRTGLDYWQIIVLAAVRLGCRLTYDRLQDLAEQHRALRQIMGIGQWAADVSFNWRRIRDNLCLIKPETIEKINHLLVAEGHTIVPEAAETSRADSFVVETPIHYPSESTLILDGIGKVIEICVPLAKYLGVRGWRQHKHLLKRLKRCSRQIERIAAKKGPNYMERIKKPYEELLKLSGKILRQATELCDLAEERLGSQDLLRTYIAGTQQVRGTARRRVIRGEEVPNEDKLFSIFEPHTQLYKRGKAGEPIQFGRLVLVYEDGVGFITHHYLMPRNAQDGDVVVEQTSIVQERLGGRIQQASFDRGFHTPQNQKELAQILPHPCLPKPGARQAKQQKDESSVQFRQASQRHPGVESAIGALQSGNGLDRCRDRTEVGFARYLALGILGRNLHILGRLLIAREAPKSAAAISQRQRPAA